MKNKINLLSLLLLCSLSLHATVYNGTCGDNLTWTLNTEDSALTISGSGDMTNYSYNSSAPWYQYRSSINTVVIGNTITSIGDYAFKYCTALTSIAIPNSVTSIGNGAFSNCNGLTSVTISNSVTSIGNGAFEYCSALTSVSIPNSVSSIGRSAFERCRGLTSVTIPNSVTSIGVGAFRDCTGLTTVIILDSAVTSIGAWAFQNCSGLTSVVIGNSVTSIGQGAFESCSVISSVAIGNAVSTISDYAFRYCSGLTSVIVGNSVTSIGEEAFRSCTALTSVTIPNSVSSIGERAFNYCNKLSCIQIQDLASWCNIEGLKNLMCYGPSKTMLLGGDTIRKLVIPNTVTSIGNNAFNDCCGLTSVTIPNSVTSIGEGAFYDCRGLTSVSIPNSITSISKTAICGCRSLTSITIPNSITSIGESSFHDCRGLTSITIPNSVTSIGELAFYDCIGLTSVTIPNSVTSIGQQAFQNCSSLTDVTIPNSVTSIGFMVFYQCSGLTSVTIPNSVTSIGGSAFSDCINLSAITCYASTPPTIGTNTFFRVPNSIIVYVPSSALTAYQNDANWGGFDLREIASGTCGSNLTWSFANGALTISGSGEMANYSSESHVPWYQYRSSINTVVISNSVTSIGDYAFKYCSGLTSVTIPDSITSIGDYAFCGCSGLTSVTIPNSVTSIGDEAFYDCVNLNTITCNATTCPTVGTDAFAAVPNSTIVYVPFSALTAYQNNINWRRFDLRGFSFGTCGAEGDNLTWILIDSTLTISGTGAMTDYESSSNTSPWRINAAIKTIIISEGISNIGNHSFSNCSNLTSVSISSSVTNIGNYAFSLCGNLKSVDIPSSVENIGNDAFWGCNGLTVVNIPASVTTIGYSAFSQCSNLASVTLHEGLTSIGNSAFSLCPALTSIIIPASVTNIGFSVFVEDTGLTSIVVAPGNTVYDSRSNCNALIETATNKLLQGCANTIIPEGVTSIEARAFKGFNYLTSLTLPESLTSIGNFAFSGCNGLTSVAIPESVTNLKMGAFEECSNLATVEFMGKNPPSFYSTNCFKNTNCNFLVPCGTLDVYRDSLNIRHSDGIIVSSRVSQSSESAFVYTISSNDASFGSVTSTKEPSCSDPIWSFRADANDGYLFKRWSDGSTQTPRTIELTQDTSIVAEFIDASNIIAFGTCGAQGDNLRWELSCDGSLSIYGTGNMYNWYTESCPWSPQRMQISSVVIQEGVTSIGVSAFSGCRNLISITIPDGVTSIGEYAFVDCNNLNSIIIPESVTSLGGDVFQNCSSLTSITIPNSVTGSLGFYMFQGCSSLRTVVIGDNITSIGHQAFCDCINLTDVTIGNSVESIESLAFSSCKKLTSINIPSSVTRIEYAAFNACYSLERVYINDIAAWCAITFVDNPLSTARHLYLNGSEISNLIIPDGVTSIGEKAFYNCISIKSVIIPNSVTSIGVGAFSHCDGIQSVNVTATNVPTLSTSSELSQFNGYTTFIVPAASLTAYKTADNWSTYANHILPDNIQTEYNITVSAYNDKSALQVEIGEDNLINVTKLKVSGTINSYDFMVFRNKMLNLHELDLSDVSIVENSYNYYGEYHSEDNVIGPMTFYDLKRLTSVILPESITKIGANAFWMTSLSSLVIPSSVQMIEGGAFYNVPIKTLILQEGLKQIGSGAFESCSITSLSTPSSLEIIGNSAFAYCNELQEVNVLSGVERIEEYAFRGCLKLTVFNVGEGLKSIGYEAFGNCSALPEMHLPDGLETIGQHSFNGCSALRELTIPSSVTSIGDGAFLSTNMQSVYVKVVDPITISQVAFSTETFQNATLYIPRNEEWSTTYWKYYYDTQWSQFVHLGEWDPTFSEFNINNDYDLDAGTIQGDSIDDGHGHRVPRHPRGHFRPGCGFIVDHTGHQHLRDGHLFYDGSRWASLIGDLRQWTDGGSHEPEANLIIDTLFCDINVEANHWYFFSFPFDVNRSQISAPGNFIFRAYDGGRRAQMNTSSGNWMDIPAGSTHLTAGTGYIFQCNQSGTLSIPMFNPDFSAEEPHTLEQHSSANAQNANWNFVGNPYTSYYQLEDINYDAPITVWNGNGYEAVRPGDDDYTFTPFQGYFVQKPNAQTTQVGHDRSKRETHGQSQAHAAHAAERRAMQQVNPNRLLVNLTITDGTNTDKTRIVYNDAHTMDYELDCDAAKFVSSEPIPQIYTTNAGVNYAINERPKGSYEAALTVKCPADGSYTITATRMDVPLFLEDRLTGAMHDLTLGGYSFFAEQGYATGRFYVRLNGNATGIADFLAQTGVSVFASDGKLNITGITDKEVNIFSASGQQVAQMTVDGLISVPTGTYLVQVGDSAMKVIVK